jgi:hypothetical protein
LGIIRKELVSDSENESDSVVWTLDFECVTGLFASSEKVDHGRGLVLQVKIQKEVVYFCLSNNDE